MLSEIKKQFPLFLCITTAIIVGSYLNTKIMTMQMSTPVKA